MFNIAFHFNALDRLNYACRLLRKAIASGAKLVVTGSMETLIQLDQSLWTFSPTDFLPHCFAPVQAADLDRTPVILASSLQDVPYQRILLNVGTQVPENFDRFERVIEIVSHSEDDKHLARERWKIYSGMGCSLTRHDLQLKASQ